MNNPTKEVVLYLAITIVTIVLTLLAIYRLAPTLLGIPEDRLLVRSSASKLPFYEVIFSKQDLLSGKFILPDPLVKSRARPLYPNHGWTGPHDILGFRNLLVPGSTDVLVIGDSQTYGNNALIWENWPHLLQQRLDDKQRVYSMATGGWGAIQYYYALIKGLIFAPRVIVVAFYTGNDPPETYSMAFSTQLGREFLPSTGLAADDLPHIAYPPAPEDAWPVEFADGTRTIFTPAYRAQSSQPHPAIDLAWDIMVNVIGRMAELTRHEGVRLVVTLIPTKEYVYREKVEQSGIRPDPQYRQLLRHEGMRIGRFAAEMESIPGVEYVDVTAALSAAALGNRQLYPEDINGHPYAHGYRVIADTLAHTVDTGARPTAAGVYLLVMPDGTEKLVEVRQDGFRIIDTQTWSGSLEQLPLISADILHQLDFAGYSVSP